MSESLQVEKADPPLTQDEICLIVHSIINDLDEVDNCVRVVCTIRNNLRGEIKKLRSGPHSLETMKELGQAHFEAHQFFRQKIKICESLLNQLTEIQRHCQHPNRSPVAGFNSNHIVCPDCGHRA